MVRSSGRRLGIVAPSQWVSLTRRYAAVHGCTTGNGASSYRRRAGYGGWMIPRPGRRALSKIGVNGRGAMEVVPQTRRADRRDRPGHDVRRPARRLRPRCRALRERTGVDRPDPHPAGHPPTEAADDPGPARPGQRPRIGTTVLRIRAVSQPTSQASDPFFDLVMEYGEHVWHAADAAARGDRQTATASNQAALLTLGRIAEMRLMQAPCDPRRFISPETQTKPACSPTSATPTTPPATPVPPTRSGRN
jgi:hypothetical protein